MIGLILCNGTDGVRKDLVALLHGSFCRKLVPHSRLTLPRKSSCKVVKGLRLDKVHALSSLTQRHYGQEAHELYKRMLFLFLNGNTQGLGEHGGRIAFVREFALGGEHVARKQLRIAVGNKAP